MALEALFMWLDHIKAETHNAQDAAAKEQQTEAEARLRMLALADVRAQQLEAFKAMLLSERCVHRGSARR